MEEKPEQPITTVLHEEDRCFKGRYPCICTDECVYNKPITWRKGYSMERLRKEFDDLLSDLKDKT